ncbi:MAG: hypothetical protein ACOCUJ_00375 [Thiohalospira sp.]
MARKNTKRKGRGSFVGLERKILLHSNTCSLSNPAFRLLVLVYEQYKGPGYNGQLCASWTLMKDRGFTSKDSLQKALRELLRKGFLIQTRQGGRHQASLFAVTFEALDECPNHHLDRTPHGDERTRPLGYWKLGYNPEFGNRAPHAGQSAPDTGQKQCGSRTVEETL